MTGNLTMWDTALNDQFPGDGEAFAAYVDGGIGNQPNYAYIVSAHPGAHHLSIALFASNDAEALDVEPGAAQVEDIPGWYARQVARGVKRPVIYASVSLMEEEIVPVVMALPGARKGTRLWTAHYGQGEHICGPRSCGQLSIDADGTQWTSSAMGRVLDQSLLAPDFFGTPAPPKPPADWVFGPVRSLTVTGAGPHSVSLSWESPATPEPLAVEHYQVVIRHGGQDVGSYPRVQPKHANPETWQGGSLKPGIAYTALVRAVAATGGGHESPWAEVTFTTAAK